MKTRTVALLAALTASLSVVACASSETLEEDGDSAGEAVSTRNLGRNDFGLTDKELVLTLDDGPGPRTKELVDFFVQEKVPAVFFEVGKNAKANPDASAYVASKSALVPGGLIVANHSLSHSGTPLPKMGVNGATSEIVDADTILAPHIKASQSQFASGAKSFFRPPYGAFTSLGETNIATINARGAAKYTGPIFWEIGGELTDKYSADWACWARSGVDIARCQAGYVAEAQLRGRGLILVHDVHSKTVDMLKGTTGRPGLIAELRSKGFKFVGLRAHEAGTPEPAAAVDTPNVSIRAESHPQAAGSVDVTVEAINAASVVVYFDQDEMGKKFSQPASGTVKGRKFAPGQHTVRVVALDAAGKVVSEQATNFIIAQPIDNDDASASNSACVNYGQLARVRDRGHHFDLFHKQVDCSTPGAFQPVAGECYKFKGKETVAKLPEAVGADEWQVQYDLTYDADPSDKSKISMLLEVGTGHIITGKRHGFSSGNRPDVALEETEVDCSKGIWYGNFIYANGTKEKFRFSKPNQ